MLKEDQLGFIRKVYGILSVQLTLTALICIIPYTSVGARNFMVQNYGIWIFCMVVGFILSCVFACCTSVGRKVPMNYILLFAFTFCEGYLVACCCAVVNDPSAVLSASFTTAALVIVLTIYAMTTKTDFTVCGGTLCVLSVVLLFFGFFSFFFGPTMRLVYSMCGVLLFGIFLIFDT